VVSESATELRERFLANNEKVRSWVVDWYYPDITWPEVPLTPSPLVLDDEEERRWVAEVAPFQDEYQWLVEATPSSQGVTHVRGVWRFGRGHEFDRLDIHTRTAADLECLAEMLTLGTHAAALKGWAEADAWPTYEWLSEGLTIRPINEVVRGRTRIGFVVLQFTRSPHSRTEIDVLLRLTLTTTAFDGSPLRSNGQPLRH
jgi:hypothetical protein